MPSLIVNTPSGLLRIRRSQCIGRYYVIVWQGERFLANCIDATWNDRPKKMRIQHSLTHGGKVVQRGDFEIVEKDPTYED